MNKHKIAIKYYGVPTIDLVIEHNDYEWPDVTLEIPGAFFKDKNAGLGRIHKRKLVWLTDKKLSLSDNTFLSINPDFRTWIIEELKKESLIDKILSSSDYMLVPVDSNVAF